MWLKTSLCVLFCGLVLTTASQQYKRYKIYEIIPKHQSESDFLHSLEQKFDDIDFFSLTKIPNVPALVMVPPTDQDNFEQILKSKDLSFTTVNSDVSKSVEVERKQNVAMRAFSPKFGFTQYHRFNEINDYLESLAKSFSSRVTVKTVGQSYEGRDIKTIRITNGDGNQNKKVLFVDAGIHAREWIAPASAMYLIHQLVENFDKNQNLLSDYDWLILPVVNPDGYEYTHTNSRFWRKTRKPAGSGCSGTDGNRNFDFHWGEVGASTSPCSETFRGPTAFSEPETKIVRDLMHSLTGVAKWYLTLHSYGNYMLYPWGYTSALPETWKDIDEVSQAGASAIKAATGSRYTVGSSTNVLYAAAGGSDDYALAVAKIPVSITMELPAGGSGFDPKPSQIKGFVEETFIGIKAMAEKIKEKY